MPRASWACILSAMTAGLGCERFFTPTDQPITPNVVRSLGPVVTSDSLIVESILIERPLGDLYIDRELWATTLAVGTPENRSLMAENGLQAGVVTGIMPTRFQDLVCSKADAINPLRMIFNNRKEDVVPTAGPIEDCKFDLLTDLAGKAERIKFKQARCGIMVRPLAVGEGRVKLWCEPQIQHGEREERFRPSEDGTKLLKFEEVPTEKYSALGFEVLLSADEYLLIGCIAEQQETLGTTVFGAEANGTPRQRLVVIRARQVNTSGTADLPAITPPGRRLGSGQNPSYK